MSKKFLVIEIYLYTYNCVSENELKIVLSGGLGSVSYNQVNNECE